MGVKLMFLNKKTFFLGASVAFLASFLITPLFDARSAGMAVIFLSSAKTQYEVGDQVKVSIRIDPKGEEIIAARAKISYPADLLEPVSFTFGGLFANSSPGQSLGNGLISVGGFNLSEGITTPGTLGEVTMKAIKSGRAQLSLTADTHLIDPNQEDKINWTTSNGLTFQLGFVEEAPPPATSPVEAPAPTVKTPAPSIALAPGPLVSSATHPDQEKWYNNKNVVLVWPKQASDNGYAFTIKNTSNVDPGDFVDDFEPEFTTELNDGAWYFTLKARRDGVFTNYSSHKIKIDATAPKDFVLLLDSFTNEQGELKHQLVFSTSDALSGVSRYELRLSGLPPKTIISPYNLTAGDLNSPTISVTAIDLAGNEAVASLKTSVLPVLEQLGAVPYVPAEPVLPPVVIEAATPSVQKKFFTTGNALVFSGRVKPRALITLYINSRREIVATTTADTKGDWLYYLTQPLDKGLHTIYATATIDGITSAPSQLLDFTLAEDFTPVTRLNNRVAFAALAAMGFITLWISWYIIKRFSCAVCGWPRGASPKRWWQRPKKKAKKISHHK